MDVLPHLVEFALHGVLGVVLVALELQLIDARLEYPLHGLLQLYVDGEVDVVAGYGVLGVHRAGYRAAGGAGHSGGAVRAVEPVLKGVLHAVAADLGVVVVAAVLVLGAVFFHVLLAHRLDVAEDVGRILGVVFADVGGLHLHNVADDAHQVGDEVYRGVLDKDIGVGVDGVAHIERVADAGYLAHLLGVIAVGYVIAGAEIAHELHGRRVLVEALAVEIGREQRALQGCHVRVLEGRLLGYGQVVDVGLARGLDHVYHLEDDGVGVLHLVGKEARVAYLEVVALAVRDQDPAVAIQDVAARGGDGLVRGLVVLALLVIGRALYYLQLVERHNAQGYERHYQSAEGEEPA